MIASSDAGLARFQSSPCPKTGCDRDRVRELPLRQVSILTLPEDRVRPADGQSGAWIVSILTLPEDRVRQRRPLILAGRRFNPHPARRQGATAQNRQNPPLCCRYRRRQAPVTTRKCRSLRIVIDILARTSCLSQQVLVVRASGFDSTPPAARPSANRLLSSPAHLNRMPPSAIRQGVRVTGKLASYQASMPSITLVSRSRPRAWSRVEVTLDR